MWESCLSGSVRGMSATEGMEKILWHRRESRRITEKTNIFLQPREAPAYSKNAELPETKRMEFRIGVNLGDVIEEKDRIYGDGVNIAARLEGLADAGGICIWKKPKRSPKKY